MNTVVNLAENIRTNTSDNLLRNISLARMKRKLVNLFVDWNAKDVDDSDNIFGADDGIIKTMKYNNCLSLNDENTIEFHQSFKQDNDVFDEKRQIWIDRFVDTINDDMFIPRDDANG